MANETQNKTEEKAVPAKSRVPLMIAAAIIIVVGGGIAAVAYLLVNQGKVYIDQAYVEAPQTALGPTMSGTLMQVYVNPGDTVSPNEVVAEVGTELIRTTSGGLVTATDNQIGATIDPGTAVVTMIDPTQLRIVGQLDENKGLANVQPGQRAVFTVDAFGGQQFDGVVDEVSPTSNASDVVFSVSDKRPTESFDVKIAFDPDQYPELKNGMSARVWIYTK